jgi:hypothetical protein
MKAKGKTQEAEAGNQRKKHEAEGRMEERTVGRRTKAKGKWQRATSRRQNAEV